MELINHIYKFGYLWYFFEITILVIPIIIIIISKFPKIKKTKFYKFFEKILNKIIENKNLIFIIMVILFFIIFIGLCYYIDKKIEYKLIIFLFVTLLTFFCILFYSNNIINFLDKIIENVINGYLNFINFLSLEKTNKKELQEKKLQEKALKNKKQFYKILLLIFVVFFILFFHYINFNDSNMFNILFLFLFVLILMITSFGDVFVLYANKISNNFCLSWTRGIIFILLSGLFIFVLINNNLPIENKIFYLSGRFDFEVFLKILSKYLKMLNAINPFKDTKDVFGFELESLPFIIYYIGQIIIGFGIYQTIVAFRKFRK